MLSCSLSHDSHGGLAEVLAGGFPLLRCWMAGLVFELIGLPLRLVALGAFLCHAHSLRPTQSRRYPCEFQTAPLPKGGSVLNFRTLPKRPVVGS